MGSAPSGSRSNTTQDRRQVLLAAVFCEIKKTFEIGLKPLFGCINLLTTGISGPTPGIRILGDGCGWGRFWAAREWMGEQAILLADFATRVPKGGAWFSFRNPIILTKGTHHG